MNRRQFLRSFIAPPLEDESLPAQSPGVPSVTTAGSPRHYARGTRTLIEDAQAWLCRDDGGFFAIDALRTDELHYLYVDLDAQGQILISRDHNQKVDPRDRLMA